MPDANLSLAILNGASSDPLTERALAALGAAGGDQAPPEQPQQSSAGADSLTDRALSMLNASPEDLRAARAPTPEEGVSMARMAAGSPSAIAGLAGMPVDAANWFLGELTRPPLSKEPGPLHSEQPIGGSEWLNNLIGKAGLGTAALPARNAPERIGQAITGGVTNMVMPFAAARAGLLPAEAASVLGAGPKNTALATGQQALIGAGSGLGGGIGEEVAPDSLKPYANIAGQLVGGGLTAGGMGLAQGAYRYGAKKIEDFRMPSQMAKAGEEGLASGAIPRAAPGGPDDVATFFTDRLNAADDLHTQHILDAAQQARESADVLGAAKSAQEIGKSMQGILDKAATKEKDAASKLYQAVDPDGTLIVPAAPLREQVGAIQKNIPQLAKPPSGEEAAIYNDVNNVGASVPFSEVQALRSRVSNAIHQEVMASGGESPALRRLSQIKAAINDSLANGAAEAAAADPTVNARLQAEQGLYSGAASGSEAGLARSYQSAPANTRAAAGNPDIVPSVFRVDDGADVGGARPTFSQPQRNAGQGTGRPGNAAGGPQVPQGTQSVAPRKPENIIDFLTARGGVFDEGGDLRAMDLNRPNKGQFGILSTKNGMSLDYAREAAEEAGFLKPGSTISDLLDAIQSHQSGHPVYRPEDAVEFTAHQRAARRGDFEQGGAFDPNDVFAEAVRSQGSQSLSEALDRLAAANQRYAEYKQTFRSGPVGKVLAPGPSKGTFATPESEVPGKLTGSPEPIAAFEKAAGGRDKAIPLVHDQLASTIPRSADGTIDAGRFPAWLDKTSKTGVFDAYPELKPRFADAAKAAEQVADANAQRLMAQRAHQKSAASLFTQGNDPVAAVGRALSGNKAEANMRELWTAATGKDGSPAAQMGIKRAIVEHIRQKFGQRSEDANKGIIGNRAALQWLRNSRPALREVFGDSHLDQIEQIAQKFARAGHGGHLGSVSDLFTLVLGEHLGHAASHVLGAVGHGIGFALVGLKKIGEAMKANGLAHLDQLIDETMLNPQLARTLTAKLTRANQDSLLARFGNQLAMLTAEAPANAADREQQNLDAVTRAVVAMEPGAAITTRNLAGLSGQSDITELRNRLVRSGLITEQNGRYVRADTANAGRALAPKEAPQPKGVVVNPAAVEKAWRAIQQNVPTLRRQSFNDLSSEIESRPSPYYGSYRPGGLVEHAAAVGQGTPLTHDVVHLLRRSGAIPREEWSVLATKAADWAKRLGVEGPRGVRQEEAIAQAYNLWKAGGMPLPPGLRRIMGGITAVAERAAA